MTTIAIDKTRDFMRMLAPLSSEAKLSIINQLTASMLKEKKKKKAGMEIFDELTGAWDDGVSPEEEMRSIRASRTSGITRKIEDL